MTGYTVHTGSSIKFSHGWDRIFSGGQAGAKEAAKKVSAKKAAKASKKKKRA